MNEDYHKRLGVVKNYLNKLKAGYVYDDITDAFTVSVDFGGNDIIKCSISADMHDCLTVSVVLPLVGDADRPKNGTELCSFINAVNCGLRCVKLCADKKGIVCTFVHDCSGGYMPTEKVLEHSLAAPLSAVIQYRAGFEGILSDGLTAEQALEVCNAGPFGNVIALQTVMSAIYYKGDYEEY